MHSSNHQKNNSRFLKYLYQIFFINKTYKTTCYQNSLEKIIVGVKSLRNLNLGFNFIC